MHRTPLRYFLLLAILSCTRAELPPTTSETRSPYIPKPGSTYDFVWEDSDSSGKIVSRSTDTMHFVVLDTGLSMLGRSNVVSISWFVGDTIFVSYDNPNELQVASTSNHWWSWGGWASMPQVIVELDDLPDAKSSPEIAAWFVPEIGFLARFANYDKQSAEHRMRSHRLIGYKLK
jgi:hypothetical protein